MEVTFRPIEEWPRPGFEPHRARERSRFDTAYPDQMGLLKYELGRLGAEALVIRLALSDRDIRWNIRPDGLPRANARPDHPGVVVEWQIGETWYGRSNDKFDDWRDCMFAIAKTLEALRGVERWGSVAGGEQYEGMRLEIEGVGSGPNAARQTLMRAAGMLDEDLPPPEMRALEDIRAVYRRAVRRTHPDRGGDPEEFRQVQEAREVLGL